MKITKSQLRKIIKEEIESNISEVVPGDTMTDASDVPPWDRETWKLVRSNRNQHNYVRKRINDLQAAINQLQPAPSSHDDSEPVSSTQPSHSRPGWNKEE